MPALQTLGCMFKVLSGLGAFVAGSGAVFLVGMPYTLGRRLSTDLETRFNDTFQGSLDLRRSHVLDAFSSQHIKHFVLRDPDGGTIAEGSLRGPGLVSLVESGVDLTAELQTLHILIDAEGQSNLARAFELAPGTELNRRDWIRIETDGRSVDERRLLFDALERLDVEVEHLFIEDLSGESPRFLEARDLTLGSNRDDSNPERAAQRVGLSGHVAGGSLDLRVDGLSWSTDREALDFNELELDMEGNNCRTLDPWIARLFGAGVLPEGLGPTVGRVHAQVSTTSEDQKLVRVLIDDEGLDAELEGFLAQDLSAIDCSDGRFHLELDPESPNAGQILPRFLPRIESVSWQTHDEPATVRARSLRLPLKGDVSLLKGELLVHAPGAVCRPMPELGMHAELVTLPAEWPLSAVEAHQITFEEGACSFEFVYQTQGGLWTVHGEESQLRPEFLSVHLTGDHSPTAEPKRVTIIDAQEVRAARLEEAPAAEAPAAQTPATETPSDD